MPTVFADVVWPALFLEGRMNCWWAIAAGLAIEYLSGRGMTPLSSGRAALADAAMNAASTVSGVILIQSGNRGGHGADGGSNQRIETFVLRKVFKQKVNKCGFWLLFGAHSITVALAMGSLIYVLRRII